MTANKAENGKVCCLRVLKPKEAALLFFYASLTRPSFRSLLLILTLTLIRAPAGANPVSPLPAISRLDSRDTMFKQFISDVEAARRLIFSPRFNRADPSATGEVAALLTIYSYIPREGDTLMGIAARCSIPYGTLASLNRFSDVEDISTRDVLLLPSAPGIFFPETPNSDLERLLFSSREVVSPVLTIPREGKAEQFYFSPGDDFTPTERIFFLNPGFHFPLRHFQVSSLFGPRINPITGRNSMHGGVDLAAPEGSEVYAVKNGVVMDLGEDPVLGKYIIIAHENNMLSLYGHLSSISVDLNEELQSGNFIGRVGSTGQSTGPHLHFEIRQNGQSRDPARLLRLFRDSAGR